MSSTDRVIFARQMTFSICEPGNEEARELFLEVRRQNATIDVSIHDPIDPFFLYRYRIDEREYENIKGSQELLIPFENLADMLANLLNNLSASKFTLNIFNLTTHSLTLKIIEPKEYKNLAHLTFEIPVANEQVRADNIRQRYHKIQLENEQLAKKQKYLAEENATLKRDKEDNFQTLKTSFEAEQIRLQQKMSELENKLSHQQHSHAELELKASRLEEETKRKDELILSKAKAFSQKILELQTSHFQESKRKETQLKEMEARLQENGSAAKELSKVQAELESTKADLIKANQIIRRLQEEVKCSYDVLGTLNDAAKNQEKVVDKKDFTMEKLVTDLKLCLHQLKLKDKELEQTQRELQRVRVKALHASNPPPNNILAAEPLAATDEVEQYDARLREHNKKVNYLKSNVQTYLDELDRRAHQHNRQPKHNGDAS